MPTPLPDYVPAPIADYINKNRISGLKGLARKFDIPHTTLCYTLRAAEHDALKSLLNFCEVIDADPNDVVECLLKDDESRRSSLKELIYRTWPSCEQLYKSGLVGDTYVQRLFIGEYGKKIIDIYFRLARGLDMSFSQLAYLFIGPERAA